MQVQGVTGFLGFKDDPNDCFPGAFVAKLGEMGLVQSDRPLKYIEITDRGRDWLAAHS